MVRFDGEPKRKEGKVKSKDILKIFIETNNAPVYIEHKLGMGVLATIDDISKELNKPVISRRLSQMTEADITGLPEPYAENVVIHQKPNWLLAAQQNPVILVLDGWHRMMMGLPELFFDLILDKKFHPDTVVVVLSEFDSSLYKRSESELYEFLKLRGNSMIWSRDEQLNFKDFCKENKVKTVGKSIYMKMLAKETGLDMIDCNLESLTVDDLFGLPIKG